MKVVQINSECGRGSTGKIAKAISEQLTDKGVENYILYSGNHHSNYPLGKQINSKLDLRVHQVLSRFFGDQGFHSTFTTLRLVWQLKKINPDIIHLHNLHGYYLKLNILFKYLSECDAKIIWTLHDCWAFTGHCTHFTLCKCDKWKTICHNCPQYHEYPYSLFFDRSKALYNRKKRAFQSVKNIIIVTPSKWLAKLAEHSFLRENEIRVINNGINLSVFKPTETNFRQIRKCKDKYIVLGVAAVWNHKKGLECFLKLAEKLNDMYQIVLVGTDEELDKLLPSKIISIHRTTNQVELAGLYTTADVFVNPTREEVFGLVNVEANACGTPVVTFHTGGCPETISDKSGIKIACDDLDALCEAIFSVCEHHIISRNECIRSAEKYDEKRKYEDYLLLYEDVINGEHERN